MRDDDERRGWINTLFILAGLWVAILFVLALCVAEVLS